jgi:uncharacterized membrane protein YbhN (UPF0104 family)
LDDAALQAPAIAFALMPNTGLSPAHDAAGRTIRVWLNRTGALLGLAGVVLVALRLKGYAGEIDADRIAAAGFVGLSGLALIYGLSNLLLAFGWWRILRHLGVDATRDWALRAYATSQLAKYVPGNVFQFAGRQAIGVAAGIGNAPLAKSAILELALLVTGGALFVPLTLPLMMGRAASAMTGPVSVMAFVALALLAVWVVARLGGSQLAAAAARYIAFLGVSGIVFAATYRIAGGGVSASQFLPIAGAYVLAWLAGLVTPGAPAGIGVREAVLLFLLGGIGAPAVILLAVIVSRAVTVLGDLAFYLAAGFWGRGNA